MIEHAVEIQDLDVVYRVRGIDRPVLRGLTLTIAKVRAARRIWARRLKNFTAFAGMCSNIF